MENYLTVAEVAERFDRCTAAVRRWAQRGHFEGAYQPHPRKWLIPIAALDGFVPPTRGRPRNAPDDADEE